MNSGRHRRRLDLSRKMGIVTLGSVYQCEGGERKIVDEFFKFCWWDGLFRDLPSLWRRVAGWAGWSLLCRVERVEEDGNEMAAEKDCLRCQFVCKSDSM